MGNKDISLYLCCSLSWWQFIKGAQAAGDVVNLLKGTAGGGLNSRHLPETHTISNKRVLCTGFFILWGQLILGWGGISAWDGSPAKRRALGFPLGQEPKLWKILSGRIRIQTTVVFKFSYIHCKPCSASSTRAGPPYQKKYPGHSPSKPII